VLGTRRQLQYSSLLRRKRLAPVDDTYQYIPLEKLLAKIVEDPLAQSHLRHYKLNCQAQFPKMRDFVDTATYKTNDFLQSHPDALLLHFFVDAYETVNVLGSHTAVHKLEGLYCVVRNVPNSYLSKLNSIFMVGLWYALDVKRYGYDKLLEPLFKELQLLESEAGLPCTISGKPSSLHGLVVAISADNLGAHSLFGYLESFSANKLCRFCEVDKLEIQHTFTEPNFKLRTKDSYDNAVKRIKDASYNASETGIKKSFILNDLKFFHCTEQTVPDCMHDVCEGVAPYEVQLVLQSLVDKKFVTQELINLRLLDFDYSLSDQNSKPPEINLANVRLQAAECWCLLRNLPLMIGSEVPREDPHWQLLIYLLRCISIIFAPQVTESLADYLSCLVEEHHDHFKSVYPMKSLLPKHHFMIHYATQLKRFGPLVNYWCMRFEGKHRFGKEVSSGCRNFKNICKTIAIRNQKRLAGDLLHQSIFKPLDTIGTASATLVQCLDELVADAVCRHFGVEMADEVYVAPSCQLGHYIFKPGCYVVVDVVDGDPQFGEVVKILSLANVTYFVFKCYTTAGFDEHYYSFHVEGIDRFSVISASEIRDCHPLASREMLVDGERIKLISTRYKLL